MKGKNEGCTTCNGIGLINVKILSPGHYQGGSPCPDCYCMNCDNTGKVETSQSECTCYRQLDSKPCTECCAYENN